MSEFPVMKDFKEICPICNKLMFDDEDYCSIQCYNQHIQTEMNLINKRISPLKAIRNKCIDCSENKIDVKACSSLKCPLWKYRLGLHAYTELNKRNPFLEPKNYLGLEQKTSSEVVKAVGEM